VPSKALQRKLRTLYLQLRDTAQLPRADSAARALLHAAGYPQARLAATTARGRSLQVAVQAGPYYKLEAVQVPDSLLALNLRLPQPGGPFSLPLLARQLRDALRPFEEKGFPFAAFHIQGVDYRRIAPDTLGATVRLLFVLGPVVRVDSLRVEGEVRESSRFVAQMARIRLGGLYNQREIDAIPRLLGNSLYYRNVQPASVEHRGGHTTVVVKLERRKANRLDGLLGLLPPRDGTQRLQFTGLLDFQLVSALRWGEVIQFKYEKLLATSQTLNASYLHPYILGSGFKALAKFNLWKQDTLFLIQAFEPGGYYQVSRALQLRFSFRAENASLLSTDAYKRTVWPPPPVMNTRTRMGAIGFEINTLDNIQNPRRGVWAETDVALGRKRVLKTVGLDSLDTSRLLLTQPRTEASALVQVFQPLWGRFVGVVGARAYWLKLAQYFASDQRYLGGARSLRGFNENEFLARFFTVVTTELRLRLDAETYIGLFADAAHLEGVVQEAVSRTRALGIGLALSVRTPAGQVQVSYAIGRQGDVPFQPTRGRIHIGLVNYF
jgi:outer membrane protein assembly factor BamA